MKTVLLIEDSVLFRSALETVLRDGGFPVTACSSRSLTARQFKKARVVLLDVVTLMQSGESRESLIKKCAAHAPVLLLGREDRLESLIAGLRAGAVGFVNQTASLRELRRAIATVASGRAWCEGSLFRRVIQTQREFSPAEHLRVTKRETQVLQHLRGGQTNREIAAHLGLSEQCIKFHVSNLLRKTGTANRTSLSLFAIRKRLAPAAGM